MSVVSALLAGGLAACLAGLFTFLAAARRFSGKIATSDAADLWKEAAQMRADYLRRIDQLNTLVLTCQQRIEELEERNAQLYRENAELRGTVESHETTIGELRKLIHDLSEENKVLKDENLKQRLRLSKVEGKAS